MLWAKDLTEADTMATALPLDPAAEAESQYSPSWMQVV